MAKFSEQEIDSILESVDRALVNAATLAKNAPMDRPAQSGQIPTDASRGGEPHSPAGASMAQSDDSMKKPISPEAPKSAGNVSMAQKPDSMKEPVGKASMDPNKPQDQGQGAPTDDAPPIDAGAADPAAQGGEAPQGGEQALEGEQGADAPLSDDELHEIYASMDPAELERHFMIIRSLLQGAYGEAGEAQGAEGAPADQGGAAPVPPQAEMGKSEDNARLSNLEQENATLKKSLEKVVSAMEIAFTPTRKAVTDLAFIQKGEGAGPEVKEFNKSELTAILSEKCKSPGLSKNDREAINDFMLTGGSKEKVLEIVKGGK